MFRPAAVVVHVVHQVLDQEQPPAPRRLLARQLGPQVGHDRGRQGPSALIGHAHAQRRRRDQHRERHRQLRPVLIAMLDGIGHRLGHRRLQALQARGRQRQILHRRGHLLHGLALVAGHTRHRPRGHGAPGAVPARRGPQLRSAGVTVRRRQAQAVKLANREAGAGSSRFQSELPLRRRQSRPIRPPCRSVLARRRGPRPEATSLMSRRPAAQQPAWAAAFRLIREFRGVHPSVESRSAPDHQRKLSSRENDM